MTRKRRSDKELSRDDDASSGDDAPVEQGTWQKAPPEELAKRTFVSVRKRNTPAAAPAFPKISLTNAAKTPPDAAPAPADAPADPEAPNPLKKFAPAPGSWKCNTCLLTNTASSAQCPACETPKPTPADQTTPAPSSSTAEASSNPLAKFAAAPGSWKCGTCLLTNKVTDSKCPACETAKPGVGSGAASAGITSGTSASVAESNASNILGVNSSEETSATSKPTFSFGVPSGASFSFGVAPNAAMSSFSSIAAPGDTGVTSAPPSSFSFLSGSSSSATAPSFQFSATTFAAVSSSVPAKPSVVLKDPEEPVKSGEEDEDLVLKVPVQLFQMKLVTKGDVEKQAYVESGTGDLRINQYKEGDSTKARMVMRVEKTHRLALNAAVFKDMAFEVVGERHLRFTAAADAGKFETYLLKAKTKQDIESVHSTLSKLKGKLD